MGRRRTLRRNHGAYTQTHTFMFRGCRNTDALLSPQTVKATEHLVNTFTSKLVEAGFTVTYENKTGKHDVMCRPFGKKFGITMGAILSGSDASCHTYPEWKFGRTFELELNLCYLPARADHAPAVKATKQAFKAWLQPKRISVFHSQKRRLYPV